jgi:iron only hydrogenase large subunit-like protein
VLRFAAVYGFRNIQTLVRKIKMKRCEYDYVEVMACPSGGPCHMRSIELALARCSLVYLACPVLHTTVNKCEFTIHDP